MRWRLLSINVSLTQDTTSKPIHLRETGVCALVFPTTRSQIVYKLGVDNPIEGCYTNTVMKPLLLLLWVTQMNTKPIEIIINTLLGQIIPVKFHNKIYSAMYYRETLNDKGEIVNLFPVKIVLSESFDANTILRNSLPEKIVSLFDQYHPMLFTVLHEVGHIKTAKGLNKKKINLEYANINNCTSVRECNRMYRQITSEYRADRWAYAFALNHPNTCVHFSNLLFRAYYKKQKKG